MTDSRFVRDKKGRRKAAFLCVGALSLVAALSGCAHFDANDHPLLSTVAAFSPFGGGADVSAQAKKIEFATIDVSLDGRGGLLVLARQQPGVTYFQSSQAEIVVLSRGYLSSTAGLQNNLEMTRLDGLDSAAGSTATPFAGDLSTVRRYTVTRRWTASDDKRSTTRTADAVLRCDTDTQSIKLPLATLPLVACKETLDWAGGGQTHSTYWIDPHDNRIWKARTEPWPGAPTFAWEVARPWW